MRDLLRALRRGCSALAVLATGCNTLFDIQEGTPRPLCVGGSSASSQEADAGSCNATANEPGPDADTVAAGECTTNAECMERAFGEPVVCDKALRQCVPLKRGAVCPFVYPTEEVKNDSVVLFGAFMPLRGQAPLSGAVALDYQLALNELQKAGGLPGGTGEPRRPMAAIFCDSSPAASEEGVQHLVQTLRVGALSGLFTETDTTRFVQDYTVPAGVFLLNPQTMPETLRNIDVNDLVLHLLGTPREVARAYRPLFARAERLVRSKLRMRAAQPDAGASPERNLRVALITSESPSELAMDSVVQDPQLGIVVNGVSASTSATAGDLRRFSIPSLDFEATGFGSTLDQVAVHRPDIVILLTDNSGLLIPPLEDLLTANAPGAPLPFYLLSSRNGIGFLDYLGSDRNESTLTKRQRFVGVQYAASAEPAPRDAWLSRMRDAYPQISRSSYAATENFYDATYWLAFGLYAAGSGAPPTGASFQRGVRKLLGGPRIFAGDPRTLSESFLALANSDAGVTFVGAQGPPSIDPSTAAWRSVGGVYCYHQPGISEPLAPTYDVLRYNPLTGELDGDFPCFFSF